MKKRKFYKHTDYIYKCLEWNIEVIRLFFKNNDYLLRKVKKTIFRQVEDMIGEGLEINKCYIYRLRNGKRVSVNITMLMIFCVYWNRKLIDMIGYDIEERERMEVEEKNLRDRMNME